MQQNHFGPYKFDKQAQELGNHSRFFCNIYSTRTKTNWTIGGVTHRRTIPQNSFRNRALSKEIENGSKMSKNTGLSNGVLFSGGRRSGWVAGISEGTHKPCRRALGGWA